LTHPNGHDFDAKVETQPLVVEKGANGDDLVIVTTMIDQYAVCRRMGAKKQKR
jgi:hypothetical protein